MWCLPQAWLAENGPFQAVLDGANIACYQRPGFFFSQIASVLHLLSRSQPQLRPLVVRARVNASRLLLHASGAHSITDSYCWRGLSCVPASSVLRRSYGTADWAQPCKPDLRMLASC